MLSPDIIELNEYSSVAFTVAKKMATCRFYQNALQVSRKNTWEKMTRNKATGLKF